MRKVFLFSIGCLFICSAIFFISAQLNDKKMVNSESINVDKPLPILEKPYLVVKKKERKLELFDDKILIRTYKIGLGFAPEGDKEKQGDGKTPEGEFFIFTKNPKSSFYLSLGVSYPSIDDAKRGLEQNTITQKEHDSIVKAINNKQMPLQKTKLGGEIYIHGNGSATDWTWGCIALDDADMKELFNAIPIGTYIKIEL